MTHPTIAFGRTLFVELGEITLADGDHASIQMPGDETSEPDVDPLEAEFRALEEQVRRRDGAGREEACTVVLIDADGRIVGGPEPARAWVSVDGGKEIVVTLVGSVEILVTGEHAGGDVTARMDVPTPYGTFLAPAPRVRQFCRAWDLITVRPVRPT